MNFTTSLRIQDLSYHFRLSRGRCLTELYVHHKLCAHEWRYRLEADGSVSHEPVTPTADPALGKLYSEADRVALATMTSIVGRNAGT